MWFIILLYLWFRIYWQVRLGYACIAPIAPKALCVALINTKRKAKIRVRCPIKQYILLFSWGVEGRKGEAVAVDPLVWPRPIYCLCLRGDLPSDLGFVRSDHSLY